jgi:hypothetical protein
MATRATTTELRRGNWTRSASLQAILVPLASLLVAFSLIGAGSRLLIIVGLPALVSRGWGVNRDRRRRRAWASRLLAVVAAVFVGFSVVFPTLLAVDFPAKPRAAVNQPASRWPHEDVIFAASDGVRLSGWYVPPRNGAAIVLVQGGGGDRQGTILHARMLATVAMSSSGVNSRVAEDYVRRSEAVAHRGASNGAQVLPDVPA